MLELSVVKNCNVFVYVRRMYTIHMVTLVRYYRKQYMHALPYTWSVHCTEYLDPTGKKIDQNILKTLFHKWKNLTVIFFNIHLKFDK